MDNKEIFLTCKEAAEVLGVKSNTLDVWRCRKRYALPYIKIGKKIRYKMSDLLGFIESRTFNNDEKEAYVEQDIREQINKKEEK